MYISERVKALGEERRSVSYHLNTLEEYGSKSKDKAIRKYWVTDKVKDVISEFKKP